MRDLDLRGLRMRLLRGGVAPKHVNRTLKELRHHFADLEQKALSEGLSPREAIAQAAEQIGDPRLIIDEALARPELKSWAYRWPWAIYGLFPVIALALVVLGSIFVAFGLLEFAESASGLSPSAFANALSEQWWARSVLEAWPVVMVYFTPSGVAGALCIFAANRDAPILWPTIGVLLILLLGSSYMVSVTPPSAPDQLWRLGAGGGYHPEHFLAFHAYWRLLIPLVLVLGPYYWWRRGQQKALSA